MLRFVCTGADSAAFEGEDDLKLDLSRGVALSSPELSSPAMASSSASSSLTDMMTVCRDLRENLEQFLI